MFVKVYKRARAADETVLYCFGYAACSLARPCHAPQPLQQSNKNIEMAFTSSSPAVIKS